jgi:hypothetical protein
MNSPFEQFTYIANSKAEQAPNEAGRQAASLVPDPPCSPGNTIGTAYKTSCNHELWTPLIKILYTGTVRDRFYIYGFFAFCK